MVDILKVVVFRDTDRIDNVLAWKNDKELYFLHG